VACYVEEELSHGVLASIVNKFFVSFGPYIRLLSALALTFHPCDAKVR
jgi:hypothetical protein